MVQKRHSSPSISVEKFAIISLSVALAVSIFLIVFITQNPRENQEISLITPEIVSATDLSTENFARMEPSASVNGSLRNGCTEVSASTESHQAESILNGITGTVAGRPNMHDMTRDYFETLGIEVLMVKVTELRGSNYIGKMIIKQGNDLLSMEIKPSDGIAIAVRTKSPIYFNTTLLNEHGTKIC
jgi:bifunctional DNase/RNase